MTKLLKDARRDIKRSFNVICKGYYDKVFTNQSFKNDTHIEITDMEQFPNIEYEIIENDVNTPISIKIKTYNHPRDKKEVAELEYILYSSMYWYTIIKDKNGNYKNVIRNTCGYDYNNSDLIDLYTTNYGDIRILGKDQSIELDILKNYRWIGSIDLTGYPKYNNKISTVHIDMNLESNGNYGFDDDIIAVKCEEQEIEDLYKMFSSDQNEKYEFDSDSISICIDLKKYNYVDPSIILKFNDDDISIGNYPDKYEIYYSSDGNDWIDASYGKCDFPNSRSNIFIFGHTMTITSYIDGRFHTLPRYVKFKFYKRADQQKLNLGHCTQIEYTKNEFTLIENQ